MKTAPASRPESLDAIAERLRRLRVALGFQTQAEFCRRFDLSSTQWNNYERAVSRIRIDEGIRLVQELGVTLDWIYLGNERWMPFELMQKIGLVRETA